MDFKLQHGEITEQIIGAAFTVYGELGYGFLESVYQKAMQVELQRAGLDVERVEGHGHKSGLVDQFWPDESGI